MGNLCNNTNQGHCTYLSIYRHPFDLRPPSTFLSGILSSLWKPPPSVLHPLRAGCAQVNSQEFPQISAVSRHVWPRTLHANPYMVRTAHVRTQIWCAHERFWRGAAKKEGA